MNLGKLILFITGSGLFLAGCATDAAYKVSSELTAPFVTDADNQAKDDQDLQGKLKSTYKQQIVGSAIDVVVCKGDVLLIGQVLTSADMDKATSIAKQNPAATEVFNYLTIGAIKPVLNSEPSLARKALTRIQAQNDLDGRYIRTAAVGGVVYILGSNVGNLSSLNQAIKGIYAMDGVSKVVNLVQPGDLDYSSSDKYE